MSDANFPYIHGFNKEEQERLKTQADFGEQAIYRDVDFSRCNTILEVGSGVGAQTSILLRRFPHLNITGIDLNEAQIQAALTHLHTLTYAKGRFEIKKMNAQQMTFSENSFDGAFLCWILEHVPEPLKVLQEVYRTVKPGARIYVTEVMNSTFFLDPYSPNTWKYWMAFNDFQNDGAGDPFVGVKLGHMLKASGFKDIKTSAKIWHFDSREPERREEVIAYWTELLLSAADQLVKNKYTTSSVVEGMKKELESVKSNPNSVFFYAFMQASALK